MLDKKKCNTFPQPVISYSHLYKKEDIVNSREHRALNKRTVHWIEQGQNEFCIKDTYISSAYECVRPSPSNRLKQEKQ